MRWWPMKKRNVDLERELRSDLELEEEEQRESGLSSEEARYAARRAFGNLTIIKELTYETWGWVPLERLLEDLRYAVRQLRRSPGFAVTAMAILALGVGANVVVFSVMNALILRPLNVPQPQSLYLVEHREHGSYMQSYPDYLDYRDGNSTFSDLSAFDTTDTAIRIGKSAHKSYGYVASGNYFDMLGIQPALGRMFHANDERGVNSAPYIVLSYDFWRERFNENPNVVGTTVDLNTHPFTVIGVAPREFHGTEIFFWPDFWIPMVEVPQIGYSIHFLAHRGTHNLWILGRLRPGVTPAQGDEDINAISARLAKRYPADDDGLDARLVKPGLKGDVWGDPARAFLAGIMGLASLVLLAACANLGGIFAVRSADRRKELAIRMAIGSSRWRIVRALMTEAVVVSLVGGVAGTAFATGLLQLLSRWQPFADFPIHATVLPDGKVYGIALLLSLISGCLFGILPARQVWESDAVQAIKTGTNSAPAFHRFTLRDLLLCVQIALCTLLVTASLVALRGMQRSLHAPLGFEPKGGMLAGTDLTMAGYREEEFLTVQQRMLEETARLPGVSAVGIIDRTLLGNGCCGSEGVFRAGTTDFRKEVFDGRNFSVSPGYLEAAGTRLLSGRSYTWHDDANSPQVAIVNATFARMMFGNAPAVGQHFLLFGGTNPKEIVGVVEDGKYQTLTEEAQPAMFFPLSQEVNSNDTVLVLRSALPSSEVASALYRTLTSINPDLPLTLHSWPEALDLAFFPTRAATAALGIMGLLAAMLAITGIFGTAAYSVSRRTRELGIRVALGAARTQLMRSALGRPLVLLACGSAAGLALGVLASQLLGQVVYEARPSDPLVLGGVLLTMVLLGLVAVWIPARRALRIDPAGLIRED
ncbi:MAG TPA: ABC transporter permease [Terracidiphilus sp.]|jgi:predicted permease